MSSEHKEGKKGTSVLGDLLKFVAGLLFGLGALVDLYLFSLLFSTDSEGVAWVLYFSPVLFGVSAFLLLFGGFGLRIDQHALQSHRRKKETGGSFESRLSLFGSRVFVFGGIFSIIGFSWHLIYFGLSVDEILEGALEISSEIWVLPILLLPLGTVLMFVGGIVNGVGRLEDTEVPR